MKGKLIYWQGLLTILGAVAAPFGAWGSGQATLQAAIVLGIIAGLAALKNWFDSTLVPELSAEEKAVASADDPVLPAPVAQLPASALVPAQAPDAPVPQPDASVPVVVPPAGPEGR